MLSKAIVGTVLLVLAVREIRLYKVDQGLRWMIEMVVIAAMGVAFMIASGVEAIKGLGSWLR